MTLGKAVESAIADGAHWVVQPRTNVEVLIHRGELWCFGLPEGWRRFSPNAVQLVADDWHPVDHVDLVAPFP